MKAPATRLAVAALVAVISFGARPARANIAFIITPTGNAQVDQGLTDAAALWSNLIADDINVSIEAEFRSFTDASTLALTVPSSTPYAYTAARGGLIAEATSVDDLSATALLPASSLRILINRTSDKADTATPYVDSTGSNATTVRMQTANAKALGLTPVYDSLANPNQYDARIAFNNAYSFDFNRANGIAAGQVDFVGAAAHEIGHALGFASGVDRLDRFSGHANPFPQGPDPGPFADDTFTFVSPLDLFRFSTRSVDTGGIGTIDWTADNTAKYFSVDGGATSLALLANGVQWGDGNQASHWKDDLGIGIMDPTLGNGEFGAITALDLRALDVIGYSIIPEPSTLGLLSLGCLAALRRRTR
jgi:hypothetical protein